MCDLKILIGPLGRLVEVSPYKCDLSGSYASRSSFKTTMGGRVVEQRGPSPRREWSVGVEMLTATERAGLEALHLIGRPPWEFITPDAMAVNALTPLESLLDSSAIGPALFTGPGAVGSDGERVLSTVIVPAGASSFVAERSGSAYLGVPVIAGETFTVSSYGRGAGGSMQAIFRNAAGSYLSTHTVAVTAGAFARRSVTAVAPANAADVLMRVNAGSETLVFGAPAVTWSSATLPWGVGRGCHKSTIDGLSLAPTSYSAGDQSFYGSQSFTVRELG